MPVIRVTKRVFTPSWLAMPDANIYSTFYNHMSLV